MASDIALVRAANEEHLVQRPHPIPLEIEGNPSEAERLDRRGHRAKHVAVQCPIHFLGGDLDPGQVTVVPQANLSETQRVEAFFSLFRSMTCEERPLSTSPARFERSTSRGAVPAELHPARRAVGDLDDDRIEVRRFSDGVGRHLRTCRTHLTG